jgi:hypothetical protein
MIITKLQGGLANQIFQWAYGKLLSVKYNTPLYLDVTSYNNQVGITKRQFSLNKFPNLKYQFMPNERNISLWSTEPEKTKIQTISDNFNFSELDYKNDTHYYLNGYWQSEKYFKEISDTIRNELSPNNDTLEKFSHLPLDRNNVSMHIRRTDYVTSNGFHPVQSIEYYQRGLDIIGEYEYIFIFSDDINWCKENLNFKNMIFMEGFDDVEDIWLMSMCEHNIIANSSFSWWGAWLNNPIKTKKL